MAYYGVPKVVTALMIWENLWTDIYGPNFHIFVCLAILEGTLLISSVTRFEIPTSLIANRDHYHSVFNAV